MINEIEAKDHSVGLTHERWNGLTLLAEKHKPKVSNTAMLDFLLEKVGVKNLTDRELSNLLSVEVINF